MKKIIVNILTSTGLTLVLLATIGTLFGAKFLFISSVFESFGANIIIHLGFLLTRKFESKYSILDSAFDIGFVILVLFIFGSVFDWFRNGTPLWILIFMAIFIYSVGLFLSIFHMREEINMINKLLKNRDNIIDIKGM